MKKSKRFKVKPPRIVEENKLERMYDGSENWLDKYLLELTPEKQFPRLVQEVVLSGLTVPEVRLKPGREDGTKKRRGDGSIIEPILNPNHSVHLAQFLAPDVSRPGFRDILEDPSYMTDCYVSAGKQGRAMEDREWQARARSFSDGEDPLGWKPSAYKTRKVSSIHWKLKDPELDLENSEDSLQSYDEDEFCCHKGCSFVYNVQENCLERPSFVMESVPRPTYLKLATLFGMDPNKTGRTDESNRCKIGHQDLEDVRVEDFIRLVETELGCRTGASADNQVEVGTYRHSLRDDRNLMGPVQENPYLKYMKRTGPKAYLASARNNLGRRSEEITKSIIRDFLEWFKSIGGEDEETNIDEAILQDLFQIGFDSPTARAIALRIKEMPVVPESLARIRNEPEFAVKKGLKAMVKMDIRLEQKPPKLFAFGTMLPKEKPSLRFQPPRNQIKKTWTECERVPPELESLKVVWEGIENLRSTIAFSNWLKNHPDITPPGYLQEKGLLNINYDEWMQMFKGFERDIESEGADADSRPREPVEEPLTLTQRTKSTRMDDYMFEGSTYSLNWKT